jgi:haloacetate dehalogenase
VFEGFKFEYVDVGDATLRVRHGGDGPPVCARVGARAFFKQGGVACVTVETFTGVGRAAMRRPAKRGKADPSQPSERVLARA